MKLRHTILKGICRPCLLFDGLTFTTSTCSVPGCGQLCSQKALLNQSRQTMPATGGKCFLWIRHIKTDMEINQIMQRFCVTTVVLRQQIPHPVCHLFRRRGFCPWPQEYPKRANHHGDEKRGSRQLLSGQNRLIWVWAIKCGVSSTGYSNPIRTLRME